MEFLIGVAIVTWVLKAALEDVVYAVRGRPSPRLEAALKADRPYGARDYFSQLWSNAWEAMANREQWADRDGARGYLGRRWGDAWERAWERHNAKARAASQPDPANQQFDDETPQAGPRGAPPHGTDLDLEDIPPIRTNRDEPGNLPVVIEGEFTENPTQKEKPMTAPTGEVVSLADALRWTEQIAKNAAHAIPTVESAIADLRGQGVGEAALGLLGQIQETYGTLVAQADSAYLEFSAHTTVKEAYHGTPQAGEKQHLLAD